MRFPKLVVPVLGAALAATACSGGVEEGADLTEAGTETCRDVNLAEPPAEPTPIRIGHGAASEEPFWLMSVADDAVSHRDTWYTMDLAPFRGTAERLVAYQAGDLDAVLISPQAQISGAARGALDLYTIATVMRESEPDAFSTVFLALDDSGIEGPSDLDGKKIAIVDEGSHLDFLGRQGAEAGGLDPERDTQFVVFPFPAQEEALRGGQIDVAGLPEPFATLAMEHGGVQPVFDASDLTDFAYDLLTVSFDREFVEDNVGAVCAWAADFASSMDYYLANTEQAKRALAKSDFIELPADVYLKTGDYGRPPGGVVDTEGTAEMMETMIEFGILEESDRIEAEDLVRPGITLGH